MKFHFIKYFYKKSLSKRSKQFREALQRAGGAVIPVRGRLLNGLTRGFLKKHEPCLSRKTRVSAVIRIGYRFTCIDDASFSVSEKDEKLTLFKVRWHRGHIRPLYAHIRCVYRGLFYFKNLYRGV